MGRGNGLSGAATVERLEERWLMAGQAYDFGRLTGYLLDNHAWSYATHYNLKSNIVPDRSGDGYGTLLVQKVGNTSNFKLSTTASAGGDILKVISKDSKGANFNEIDSTLGDGSFKLKVSRTRLAPPSLKIGKNYSDKGTFSGSFLTRSNGVTITGNVNGTASAAVKLTGTENVSTPVSQFPFAVKGNLAITLKGTLHARAAGQTRNFAFEEVLTTTFWAVEDVGVVKSQDSLAITLTAGKDHERATIKTDSVLADYSPRPATVAPARSDFTGGGTVTLSGGSGNLQVVENENVPHLILSVNRGTLIGTLPPGTLAANPDCQPVGPDVFQFQSPLPPDPLFAPELN